MGRPPSLYIDSDRTHRTHFKAYNRSARYFNLNFYKFKARSILRIKCQDFLLSETVKLLIYLKVYKLMNILLFQTFFILILNYLDEVLDEVLWMGIDPMVICSEYRLERMEGAEEFLKCLGFSYLEIRMFLALPTNMKVRFIVDKSFI